MEPVGIKIARIDALREQVCECCTLSKQDIPEVERRIGAVLSPFREQYDRNTDEALDVALLLLLMEDGVFVAGSAEAARLADMVLLEMQRALQQMPRPLNATARVAGRQLLVAGGRFIGKTLPASPETRALSNRAGDDMEFWFKRAFRDRAAVEQMRSWIMEFLTDPAHRTPTGRLLWVQQARALIEQGRSSLRAAADLWGYRWFNLGLLRTHEAEVVARPDVAVRLLAFNNPPAGPDARTTPFCRWVHGREIAVSRAQQQVVDYFAAIDDGDAEAAKAAWPVLSGPEAVGASGNFEGLFRELGLPPYHYFCRTLAISTV